MALLNIRNLPDHVHRRLRIRAAKAGRSMEAEARAILAAACETESATDDGIDLPGWVNRLYGRKKPKNVVDEFIAERRNETDK
jgi:hypothetical protein